MNFVLQEKATIEAVTYQTRFQSFALDRGMTVLKKQSVYKALDSNTWYVSLISITTLLSRSSSGSLSSPFHDNRSYYPASFIFKEDNVRVNVLYTRPDNVTCRCLLLLSSLFCYALVRGQMCLDCLWNIRPHFKLVTHLAAAFAEVWASHAGIALTAKTTLSSDVFLGRGAASFRRLVIVITFSICVFFFFFFVSPVLRHWPAVAATNCLRAYYQSCQKYECECIKCKRLIFIWPQITRTLLKHPGFSAPFLSFCHRWVSIYIFLWSVRCTEASGPLFVCCLFVVSVHGDVCLAVP